MSTTELTPEIKLGVAVAIVNLMAGLNREDCDEVLEAVEAIRLKIERLPAVGMTSEQVTALFAKGG